MSEDFASISVNTLLQLIFVLGCLQLLKCMQSYVDLLIKVSMVAVVFLIILIILAGINGVPMNGVNGKFANLDFFDPCENFTSTTAFCNKLKVASLLWENIVNGIRQFL